MSAFPLFDYAASQQLRDRGMSQAASKAGSEWLEAAIEDFVRFLKTTGCAPLERWREDWLKRGMPEPLSSNAYGSVAQVAARRGLIVRTGLYLPAKSVKTHSHPVAEWRANGR